jgi:hypothetical protein
MFVEKLLEKSGSLIFFQTMKKCKKAVISATLLCNVKSFAISAVFKNIINTKWCI